MSSRIYPRKVWVLMPSFKPVEVEVIKHYASWLSKDCGDITVKGKCYAPNQMFSTKSEAIAAGRAEIERLRLDIDKRTYKMCQRIAALDKAEEA